MEDKRFGRYQVASEIGRGGMSVVYHAHDPALDRAVAIKVLHPHLAERDDSRERFTREARAVARLHHPSIVEVFDYAPEDAKQSYIVTEYIDGPTLRQFVEAHPLRHSEAAALLMIPVLEALDHAHAAGIVHRDVKPENIMLRPDGTPVLMDFGIAQMVDQDTLTATGTMLGSPAHMAPEIVEGEEVTTAADVFSVGTVLYWLVCGALPFTGPNPAALFRRLAEGRYDPVLKRRPRAGRAVARIIEGCMAKQVEDRPQSAGAVARLLRDLLAVGGLADATAELQAFLKDPEVYQDRLARRLVPAYVAEAEKAWAARLSARALDFLDRALSLDEDDETAQLLLQRIERGRRRGRAARLLALAALVGGGGGLAVWLALPTERLTMPTLPDVEAPVSPATTAAAPLDAAVPPPRIDASPPADAAPPRDAAPVDAAAPKSVARRPRPRPRRPVTTRPDAALPPAAMVQMKLHGKLGGTKVLVDGTLRGYLATYRQVSLRAGGRYVIEFKNPGCQVDRHEVTIPREATRVLPLDHQCRWLPAYLKVASNVEATVFNEAGRPIGKTNHKIRVPMSTGKLDMAITVSAQDEVRKARISLRAGADEKRVVMNF